MYAFGDSFDLYTNVADMVGSYWDTGGSQGSMGFQPGRFTGGRCLSGFPNNSMSKTSGSNDAVHHFVLAFLQTSALTGTTLGFITQLVDGSTNQCCIVFRSDGAILLTSGASTGTVLATYTGAVTANNQWFMFEIEVVINNTTGSITIRKNGNTGTPDFTATGLNTRNSVNNYANKITIGNGSTAVSTHYVDDFLWRSDPSSVPWVGDIRCYTRMPVTDSSVQFSRTGSSSHQMYGSTGVTGALGANVCEYMQITAPRTGLLGSVSFDCTTGGGTGHVKLALFSSVGNAIGTVLATSNEVTNPSAGIVTATFPTPYRVLAGTTYWVGIIQDASITYRVINSSSAGFTAITLSTTPYASWPVSNPGGTPAAINVPGSLTLYLTPSNNADAVGEPQQDGVTTYVSDSVVGHQDFYGIAARNSPAPPATTLLVTTRGFMQRSDAGARTAAVQVKSGATTVQSTPTQPSSGSFSWLYRTDLTDPNTGAAWVPSAVDAVQVGPCIVS